MLLASKLVMPLRLMVQQTLEEQEKLHHFMPNEDTTSPKLQPLLMKIVKVRHFSRVSQMSQAQENRRPRTTFGRAASISFWMAFSLMLASCALSAIPCSSVTRF